MCRQTLMGEDCELGPHRVKRDRVDLTLTQHVTFDGRSDRSVVRYEGRSVLTAERVEFVAVSVAFRPRLYDGFL